MSHIPCYFVLSIFCPIFLDAVQYFASYSMLLYISCPMFCPIFHFTLSFPIVCSIFHVIWSCPLILSHFSLDLILFNIIFVSSIPYRLVLGNILSHVPLFYDGPVLYSCLTFPCVCCCPMLVSLSLPPPPPSCLVILYCILHVP